MNCKIYNPTMTISLDKESGFVDDVIPRQPFGLPLHTIQATTHIPRFARDVLPHSLLIVVPTAVGLLKNAERSSMNDPSEARRLLEHWERSYSKAFGISYPMGTLPENLQLIERLLENLGNERWLATYCVEALLGSKQLEWVSNKTLAWLSNPRNLTWLLPAASALARSGPASRDWRQGRSDTPKATIRKRLPNN